MSHTHPEIADGYGLWSKAPTGQWVIYGRHDMLTDALEHAGTVEVKRRDGDIDEIRIEHVTDERRDGTAYGWPLGTRAYQHVLTRLPKVEPTGSQRIRGTRRHSGTRRAGRRR